MGTTIGNKDAASTETGHTAMGPPAVSNIPPMTPPKPDGLPAPFPYVGKSSTATKTATKVYIGGGQALIDDCEMAVEKPGNQPSQPAPVHDLVTMQVNAKIAM